MMIWQTIVMVGMWIISMTFDYDDLGQAENSSEEIFSRDDYSLLMVIMKART